MNTINALTQCKRPTLYSALQVQSLLALVGLAFACTALVKPALADPITVDLTAGLDERFFADSSSTALPAGNQVRVGFFTAGFNFAANANDLVTMAANFTEFGSALVTIIGGQAGRIGVSFQTDDLVFADENISIWNFKTSDDLQPTADFSNVTEHGVFTSSDPQWIFMNPLTDFPPTSLINTDHVDAAPIGTIQAGWLRTTPIREPSALFLSLIPFSALWFASHRRRHPGAVLASSGRKPNQVPSR